MKKLLIPIYFLISLAAKADEGMWLPFLLQQLNAQEMYIKGLKIPVEDIYNTNKNSLKDAVVLFGGGCTGEMISYQGLLLTNHHCGYGAIQSHSTVEHNYLQDGFWAKKLEDEIPCPGLTVTFVITMEDVSQQVIPFLNDTMDEAQRLAKVKELCSPIEKKAIEGTHYDAQVKSFLEGNQYILIVTETFKDVRLAGAPPSSIGNFGGEVDNWMWPRHTGDFSLFRIYANSDNKPAAYNASNVPFKPRYAFPISIKGVKEGDFTMVYGFPGRTQEYLSSYAVDMIMNVSDPNRIAIRDKKIEVMESYMKQDEKIFIQYASKLKGMANAYKKWKGEVAGLKQLDALQKKRDKEKGATTWISMDPSRKNRYGDLFGRYENIYKDYSKLVAAQDYYSEAGLGIELTNFAWGFNNLITMMKEEKPNMEAIDKEVERLQKGCDGFFKDYHMPLDKMMMSVMLSLYYKNVSSDYLPAMLKESGIKNGGNFAPLANTIFDKSIFSNKEKIYNELKDFNLKKAKKIEKDPAYQLAFAMVTTYQQKLQPAIRERNNLLAQLNRLYIKCQQEMMEGRKFYPDANSTLRVAYGQVAGYFPKDAVTYTFQTTLDGLMQKMDQADDEFSVPQKLIELYDKKDYGRYGIGNTLPIAFIASNHTTGGNSGSPVLNDMGQLIGTNYDRVWEGTMSDIMFNPERCRNITLDIRYTLFIIEKFAGAENLIKEINIIN